MQRFFSTFPAHAPGLGLLILRMVIGLILLDQGAKYLSDRGNLHLDGLLTLSLLFSTGVGLLAGILTPAFSLLVVLAGIGYGLSLIPSPTSSLLSTKVAVIQLIALGLALLCLGPGAFSLDAWLFGRREILIPNSDQRRREHDE